MNIVPAQTRIARLSQIVTAMQARARAWENASAERATLEHEHAEALSRRDRLASESAELRRQSDEVFAQAEALTAETPDPGSIRAARLMASEAQGAFHKSEKSFLEASSRVTVAETAAETARRAVEAHEAMLNWLGEAHDIATGLAGTLGVYVDFNRLLGIITHQFNEVAGKTTAIRSAHAAAVEEARVASAGIADAMRTANEARALFAEASQQFNRLRELAINEERIRQQADEIRGRASAMLIDADAAKKSADSLSFDIQSIDARLANVNARLARILWREHRDGDRLARARKRIESLKDRTRFMEDQSNVGVIETAG